LGFWQEVLEHFFHRRIMDIIFLIQFWQARREMYVCLYVLWIYNASFESFHEEIVVTIKLLLEFGL
jgi:hypothetical protein